MSRDKRIEEFLRNLRTQWRQRKLEEALERRRLLVGDREVFGAPPVETAPPDLFKPIYKQLKRLIRLERRVEAVIIALRDIALHHRVKGDEYTASIIEDCIAAVRKILEDDKPPKRD